MHLQNGNYFRKSLFYGYMYLYVIVIVFYTVNISFLTELSFEREIRGCTKTKIEIR